MAAEFHLQDALNVNFINNTVISNDTTASSGVLFNTLGAPQASVPPPGEPSVMQAARRRPISPQVWWPSEIRRT